MTDREESAAPPASVATSDVAALRASLAAAERRAAALAELTVLMSQGRDPLALAQRAVELTARATKAAGAFVYLWDRDEERLVLRVATEGHQRDHVGEVKLRMGEGITGWVALTRQTAVVPTAPHKDPRFKSFPELLETTFRSMVAVPIVAPGEEVLGVFSLYALTERGFTPNDVSIASEVGSLLASGLVQAETLSQLRVQSAAASFLRDLPDETWGSLEGCLRAMARQCAADVEADVCLVEMATDHAQPQGGLTVIEISQRFRGRHAEALPEGRLDKATLLQLLAPLGLHRLRIPLGTGAPIGALTCYRSRRFTPDVELLVESIAAQIAAGALSLYGTQRARPIVDQLLSAPDAGTTERLLTRYGWSDRPSWATVIRPHWPAAADPLAEDDTRVREVLHDVFGADGRKFLLLGGGRRFLALAEADREARDRLYGRIREMKGLPPIRLIAGMGPVAPNVNEMHRGIRHAVFASHWAELAGPTEGTVVRYEDVAHLRLLPRIVMEISPDLQSLLVSLGELVKYDLENGTDLAQTLDSFLTSSGSVAKSSAQLFVHRNTLRQRLQRIEELIGQSPEEFEDWVTAGMAVRLIRASEAELSRQYGPRASAPARLGGSKLA